MKKTLALVLALVLTLTVAAALAGPSTESTQQKTNGQASYNYNNVSTTTDTETKLTPLPSDTDATAAIKQELKDAADNNKLKEVLPLEGDYSEVNEMVTVKIPAGSIYKTFKVGFQTPYTAGTKVQVLIGVPQDDGTTLWISVIGTVNDKNEIVFTLSDADYNKVAGKEVVIIPASKPKK